jgi:hypothetical protein
MTQDQAGQWLEGHELQRQHGQDFGTDQTGTGAVGRILQRGEGGSWNVEDKDVMSHGLSSPNAARQVLRAGGEAARPGLQQAFMDDAFRVANPGGVLAPDQQPLLAGPAFMRYWTRNRDTAAAVFAPEQMQTLDRLASDFGETASSQASARASGSDTARNLSVASVIARASGGLLDPSGIKGSAGLALYGKATTAFGAEHDIRDLLTRAMADPELASRLLAKATPAAIERAQNYIGSSAGGRIANAAADSGARLGLRAASLAPVDPEQRRRDEMARRLR